MAIRADSLKVRLFVAVAVWAVTVIVAAAILLTGLYRQTVERRFERELDLHLYNLIAVTDFNPSGGLRGQPALSDPRFGTFLSGWYWVIERLSES